MERRPQTFYATYVSVVYGFVAVKGLEEVLKPDFLRIVTWPQWAMFAGTLIVGLHFWLICLSSDEVSDRVYDMLIEPNRSSIDTATLVIDILYATAFAAPILIMYRCIAVDSDLFYTAFAALTVVSLLYDITALMLGAVAGTKIQDNDQKKHFGVYISLYGRWFIQDICYLGFGFGLWQAVANQWVAANLGSIIFGVGVYGGVVFDVIFWNPELYRGLGRINAFPLDQREKVMNSTKPLPGRTEDAQKNT